MRRRILLGLAACLSLFVSGCDWHLIRPDGPAPLRYRDEVFTNVTTTSNVVYGSAVDQNGNTITLQLDVYEPAGDTAASRPAIVWVHGGGFSGGSKTSPEIVNEAQTFARKGYLGVSISYRLWPGGCFPPTQQCLTAITQAKEDAQAAVRFLRRNAATYRVDTDRIAIGGTSAGAITAINVAYDPTNVGNSGNPGFPSHVRAAQSLSGCAILTSADPGEAAALLFHGTADRTVNYQCALDTVTDAQDAGIEVFLTAWEGAGHVPWTAHRTEIIDQTTNFFYWELDASHAAQ